MMRKPSRINIPAGALLISVVALLGYQAWAMRAQQPLTPAVVGCVDLESVFKQLTIKVDADKKLQALSDELMTKAKSRQEKIEQMQSDLADLAEGSPRYRELEDATLREAEQYRGFVEFVKSSVDLERARTIKQIYDDIKTSAHQMGTSNGYDLVLVNDSLAEIPPGTEEEMNRQISARRILFASPRIDLTNDVIAYMNAAAQKAGANP